jgi:hypothetical protein
MEVTASSKHSCLLQYGNNYSRKKVYSTGLASTFQAILKFCNLAQAEVLKLFVVATAKASLLGKRSSLASALGVNNCVRSIIFMSLATLCCDT